MPRGLLRLPKHGISNAINQERESRVINQETAKEIKDVMSVDPIHVFETLSGKSWKENSDSDDYAMMAFAIAVNAQKNEVLKRNRDSYFGMSVDEYISLITQHGFEQVLCDDFTTELHGYNDKHYIFWHHKGLLLSFDTFDGRSVNGGKIYYNWAPDPGVETWNYTSSGFMQDDIWIGDHDCREGIIANLTAMESAGKFLNPWTTQPITLWLLNYADTKEYCGSHLPTGYYKVKVAERLSRLPEHVKAAIGKYEVT